MPSCLTKAHFPGIEWPAHMSGLVCLHPSVWWGASSGFSGAWNMFGIFISASKIFLTYLQLQRKANLVATLF